MRVLLSFSIFLSIKLFAKLFYKLHVKWIGSPQSFDKIRLIVLLNHTSLYEPLYISAAPNWFLWRLARKMLAPAADKTLNRPFVGFFWKTMAPGPYLYYTKKR